MAVRREDPNYPDYAPSRLVEAILELLEKANVDEKTCDAISLVVEAAQSQVAGEHAVDDLLRNPRLSAALQGLRSGASLTAPTYSALYDGDWGHPTVSDHG